MKKILLVPLSLFALKCSSDPIRNRFLSFSPWRAQETLKYVESHYRIKQDSLEMLPVMVVSHYTAIDTLEASFEYMNKEEMEKGRSKLKKAGLANIAVHFLVDKDGTIYRLMPENHIGRHTIGLNRHAVGIENVGLNKDAMTMAQVKANAFIVRALAKKYPIRYLIAHSEYRTFENTPLWEEHDQNYRTEKFDPGDAFMAALRHEVRDLHLSQTYDRSEIPARLEWTLNNYMLKNEFNGVALVVDQNKILLEKSFGRRVDSKKSLQTPDRFYVASIAKSITALAIARMVAKEKLSYTTPVLKFFPAEKSLLQGVQVRHLLAHTSGLQDYYGNDKPEPGFDNAAALVRIFNQTKPLSKAGKKFHYSNANYVLLAEIASKIEGRSFESIAREYVIDPTKMENAFFLSELDDAETVVLAENREGKAFRYPYKTVGPGGVAASVSDFYSLDSALWEHSLFSKKQTAKIFSPQAFDAEKKRWYAYGWYVEPKRNVQYHFGNFNGYHGIHWMNARKKQSIILLANRFTEKIPEIAAELDRALNGLAATPLN